MKTVGLLHPGAMGASVGAAANRVATVYCGFLREGVSRPGKGQRGLNSLPVPPLKRWYLNVG